LPLARYGPVCLDFFGSLPKISVTVGKLIRSISLDISK